MPVLYLLVAWAIAGVWEWQASLIAAAISGTATYLLQMVWQATQPGSRPWLFHLARSTWEVLASQPRATVATAAAVTCLAGAVQVVTIIGLFTYVRDQAQKEQMAAALAVLTLSATARLAVAAGAGAAIVARPTLDDLTRAQVFTRIVGLSVPAYTFSLLLSLDPPMKVAG